MGMGGVTMEFKAFQLIIGGQIPTTNEILSIAAHGQSTYRSATELYLIERHGQLSVKVDERLLPLILLHTEDYHVAAAVAGDIDRLMGLAAKIRYLVGIVAQVGNRTNGRHDSHLLIGIV